MAKKLKKLILRNWTAKLAALVLAIAIWYLIHLNLTGGNSFFTGTLAPLFFL